MDVEICAILRLNDPSRKSIAIWDGSTYTGDGRAQEKWIWLPKNLVSWKPLPNALRGQTILLSLPEWLAKKAGLI